MQSALHQSGLEPIESQKNFKKFSGNCLEEDLSVYDEQGAQQVLGFQKHCGVQGKVCHWHKILYEIDRITMKNMNRGPCCV